jgi:rhodanese-related sulfurtransferase
VSVRIWRVAAILAGGALLGLSWNGLSGHGFALTSNVYVKPGDELVEAVEARRRLDLGALFLDARERPFYEMSRIPGALNLPEPDFEAAFARLEPRLRGRFDVIVYCSGFGCEASHIVARKLKQRGIPAAVLNDGLPAWEDLGYPTQTGAEP